MKYKLYGMVNHEGSLTGGHYTATIRSKKDKAWYEFNDDYVKKVIIICTRPYVIHAKQGDKEMSQFAEMFFSIG